MKRFALLLGVLAPLLTAFPVRAAERIYFNYGLLGFSIEVKDLETFAQSGQGIDRLGYLSGLLSGRKTQVQDALQTRYQVDPTMAAQFSYTRSGEQLLQEAGDIFQTASRQNGASSLRAALILAADDSQGLSAINFLRQLPTDMRIDVGQAFRLMGLIRSLLQETDRFASDLEQQSAAIAQSEAIVDWSKLPDLRQAGNVAVQKQTFTVQDAQRNRSIVTDLYLPDAAQPVPLIVISNGLGARRDLFDELAQQLASHGFAVAVPEHPGSNRDRLLAFYQGLHRENFDATEYVDRPRDVIVLLDDLTRRNQSDLNDRLNLQQVGVFGYSFGGTTALSLAGAQFDRAQLQANCQTQRAIINISLLYQCRALDLPQLDQNLRDDRIKAIYLFVPFGRSLFGQAGLRDVKVPVFWEATDQDILTPLLVEQLPAYRHLTAPQKYLAVAKGLPHARLTHDTLGGFTNRQTPWSELKRISQTYHSALTVAFFKTYIVQDETYQPFLQANYTQVLSDRAYPIGLIQGEIEGNEAELDFSK
ncbi:alpha/beta hydrolase [Leptolyngbya sp. FACHB-711]|uniref:alpha/beta hydrolase n=1 Tax=unclassified Leptolyngbya TaxID=2650499 RepID=UPI001687D5EF|nr:alpha/beta hydrolase [Leptolyngbya sp. FACHB-711]MBD1850614.1 alpha/beta hydrolase [Cyanobacteria bacterium FACHB-502]MBD2023476.1 alpha/beta hydrolase [Leptolyngbya sp. FACHB-711]